MAYPNETKEQIRKKKKKIKLSEERLRSDHLAVCSTTVGFSPVNGMVDVRKIEST